MAIPGTEKGFPKRAARPSRGQEDEDAPEIKWIVAVAFQNSGGEGVRKLYARGDRTYARQLAPSHERSETVEDVFGRRHALGGTHVHPRAFMNQAKQSAL